MNTRSPGKAVRNAGLFCSGISVGLLFLQFGLSATELNPIHILQLFFLIVLCGYFTLKRLLANNISSLVYGFFFMTFGVAPVVSLITGAGDEYLPGSAVVLRANFIVILSVLALYWGEQVILQRHPAGLRGLSPQEADALKRRSSLSFGVSVAYWGSLILSTAGFIYIFVSPGIGFEEFVSTPRLEITTAQYGIFFVIARGLTVLSAIPVYIAFRHRRSKLVPLLVLSLCLVAVTLYGARFYALYIVCPVLYYYVTGLSINWRALLRLALVAVISFVAIVGLMFVFRWQHERSLQAFADVVFEGTTYELMINEPDSDWNGRNRFFVTVDIFPRRYGFLWGNTYKTMALFWLRSSWAPDLKKDTMYKLQDAIVGRSVISNIRFSNHPTLIGDWYLNFGYAFALGAFLWGLLFGWVQHLRVQHPSGLVDVFLGSAWTYFITLAARGSIYVPFMFMLVCGVFLLGIGWAERVGLKAAGQHRLSVAAVRGS